MEYGASQQYNIYVCTIFWNQYASCAKKLFQCVHVKEDLKSLNERLVHLNAGSLVLLCKDVSKNGETLKRFVY